MASTTDPTVAALIQLASQLGIAAIFILAWWQERKERQALTSQMTAMQDAYRAENLKVIERMFEVLSGLHVSLPSSNTAVPPITEISKN
jgi:hypothetical protein